MLYRFFLRSLHFLLRGAPVLLAVALILSACATTENGTSGASGDAEETGLRLARQVDRAKTVQLYRGSNERALPILRLRGSETLTLAFDLMGRQSGPVSVYFYHADRTWDRAASASRFLSGFQSDTVLEYEPSRGTEVAYTHYRYSFPNDNIQFEASGNFIVRVTEQGREDAVLFERPFFVTEDAGTLRLSVEGLVVTGYREPLDRPIASYVPPSSLSGTRFDYTVCFARNRDLATTRCADRSRLRPSEGVDFELSRPRAYEPSQSRHALDLSQLRVGARIERVDRSVSPFQVLLEPDYARFAGTPFRDPLDGQVLVRDAVTGFANPNTAAEYVQTTFAFVPPNEVPVQGEIMVAGGFSGDQVDADNRLAWVESRGRYEGDILLKQGQYEYFYVTDDPGLRAVFNRNLTAVPARYVAFVYFRDVSLGTDRLVRVGTVRGAR